MQMGTAAGQPDSRVDPQDGRRPWLLIGRRSGIDDHSHEV
jgi:hypothetical protein